MLSIMRLSAAAAECRDAGTVQNGYWKCQICKKIFARQNTLTKHMRMFHQSVDSNVLKISMDILSNGEALNDVRENKVCKLRYRKYVVTQEGHKRYHECHICHKMLLTKLGHDEHMSMHEGNRPFKCPSCEKKFVSMKQLISHKSLHIGKRYTCTMCPKSFVQKGGLARHQVSHTGRKQQCHICHKTFTRKDGLRQHMRIHTGETPYRCEVCGDSFKTLSALTPHRKRHCGGKKFYRPVSKKSYMTSLKLKEHLQTETACSLETHQRLHSIEKSFKCQYCPATFVESESFRLHIEKHTTVRPYSCHLCDKSFLLPNILNSHIKKHNQVIAAQYACNFCEKVFRTRHAATVHLVCHSEDRPFVCEVCEKAFKRKLELKRHVMLHTGVKEFKCSYCAKAFVQKYNAVKHERSHERKPAMCTICGQHCRSNGSLVHHLKTAHGTNDYGRTSMCSADIFKGYIHLQLPLSVSSSTGSNTTITKALNSVPFGEKTDAPPDSIHRHFPLCSSVVNLGEFATQKLDNNLTFFSSSVDNTDTTKTIPHHETPFSNSKADIHDILKSEIKHKSLKVLKGGRSNYIMLPVVLKDTDAQFAVKTIISNPERNDNAHQSVVKCNVPSLANDGTLRNLTSITDVDCIQREASPPRVYAICPLLAKDMASPADDALGDEAISAARGRPSLPRLTCVTCGASFREEYDLKKHLLQEHVLGTAMQQRILDLIVAKTSI